MQKGMAFLLVLVPNHLLGKILDHAIENLYASIPMSTMSSISPWEKMPCKMSHGSTVCLGAYYIMHHHQV
jgi:hypothetical protein